MKLQFTYVNAKGEKATRNVVVIHESEDKIAGFDLKKLSRTSQNKIKKAFGSKPVSAFPTEKKSIDYSQFPLTLDEVRASYRTFNKSNIQ